MDRNPSTSSAPRLAAIRARHGHPLLAHVALLAVLAVAAALPSSAAPAAAPPQGTRPLPDLAWRSIGPFRGGRVLAVAGVPGEREHLYFGSVNGGVWETTDAGRTWKPIFDGQPIGTVGALAIAPSSPKVIYVGTGEADMRSDIAQGNGVYRSADGGRTWTHVGLADTQQIGRILVDPKDPDRLFVAALGHPYGPNAERGVFRSLDGGRSWEKVLFRDADTGAIDLAFRPGDPRTVYAALWRTRRPPWNVYPPSNGPGSGLYVSSDGGTTWRPLAGNGLPAEPGRIGIGVAPSRPDRLYVVVDADDGGVFRSDDAGRSFVRTCADPRVWGRGWYFGGIAVEPREPDTVYVGNTSLYRSTDGGRTFQPVKGAPGGDDYHEIWIDPVNPERRMLGVDQGAVVSLNGGETWSSWYNQPTAQFYRLATDSRFPYWVYGSQQDSGAAGVPSRTTTRDGITMMEFREVTAGGENDSIAPDPKDPDRIFGGRVEMLDLKTGQTHDVDATLAFPDRYRGTWTLPLLFAPRDPAALYFANQRLFRTTDGGKSWKALSPDLSREAPGAPPNLDAAAAANDGGHGPRRGVIFSVAPSRAADRDIWAGTDDGLVWRTTDDGARWTDVTPKGLSPWSKVAMIETSRFDAATAYVAVDRHRLDDFAPYVYRTRDGGKSWTLSAAGIPAGSFVNAVREDPKRRGLLYAGTEKGVYVSFDDGDRWQPLQLNLPVTSVRDVAFGADDVVIATHGRGFWVLDDATPLRQLDGEVLAEANAPGGAWLFSPAAAVRVRPAGFTGTPLPKDEPMAPNPPAGAVVDYVLGPGTKGPVTLTIRDAEGRLVRRYASDDRVPPPSRREKVLAPEWLTPPAVLSAAPGFHRYRWSLRYAPPPALARGNAFADGVWAPPGRYSVELAANGKTLARPLVLEPDPRVALPPDAYGRQLDLARRVEAARASAAIATKEAEELHAALRKTLDALAGTAGGSSTGDAALRRSAEELDRKVVSLAELADETSPRAPAPPPADAGSLRFLSAQLGKLASAIDGADADPTPDAREGLARSEAGLSKALEAWARLRTTDLALLDAALAKAGRPTVAVPAKGDENPREAEQR